MLDRRKFIGSTVTLATSAIIFPGEIFNSLPLLDMVSIQLFSLPKLLDKDLPYALSMLSKMGYKAVEIYGPYPFSSEAGKKTGQQ